MVKSLTYTVEGAAPVPKETRIYPDFDEATHDPKGTQGAINVSPTSGTVPFDVDIWGILFAPSVGYLWRGLSGKVMHLYVDGVDVAQNTTHYGTPPGHVGGVDGIFHFVLTIAAVGSHEIYVEFPGDAEYAGCES